MKVVVHKYLFESLDLTVEEGFYHDVPVLFGPDPRSGVPAVWFAVVEDARVKREITYRIMATGEVWDPEQWVWVKSATFSAGSIVFHLLRKVSRDQNTSPVSG